MTVKIRSNNIDPMMTQILADWIHPSLQLYCEPESALQDGGKTCKARTDIVETASSYILFVDLPGLSKEQISVYFDEVGLLVITGQRSDTQTDEKFLLRERTADVYERKIKLGKDADMERVEAKFENGVLQLQIARHLPSKKPITIN